MTQGCILTTRDQVRGCLAGLAIGDALGMPVETMTRQQIMEATDGKGVTGFLAPIQRRIQDTRGLAPGMTTDDTQLAFAVAKGFLSYRGFHLGAQARQLVEAYRASTFGWGRSTTQAAKDLDRCYETDGKEGRAYDTPAPPPKKEGDGCGNGVAMKIAPLALWDALTFGMDPEPFISHVMELGLQTHGDPRASFAALAVAGTVRWAIMHGTEAECLCPLIDHTMELVDIVETRYQFFRRSQDTLTTRLQMAFGVMHQEKELERVIGAGCFSLESVPFALATFHRNPLDFRKGVLEAVNAGGDTDTTAAMVGAMIGAHVGLPGIPMEWLEAVPDCRQAVTLADEMYLDRRHPRR